MLAIMRASATERLDMARKHRQKSGVLILEIGVAASIAMIGAMLVLLVLVRPADSNSDPILSGVATAVTDIADTGRLDAFTFQNEVIEDTSPARAFGRPWPPRFIVRFDPHGEGAVFLRNFRENRHAARAGFENWASESPVFSGFHLEGLTSSGEAILSYRGVGETAPSLTLQGELIQRLNSSPYVIYTTPFEPMRAAAL